MRLRWAANRRGASTSGVRGGSTETSSRAVFQRGDKVEVRSDEDGFRGVWYEAVVLRRLPTRHHRYLVSYATLVSEEDPPKPLREVIHRSDVRPLPPPPPAPLVEGYRIHARVEAFHNDGWWSGVVSGLPLPGRYTVCFPTSREEIEFEPSELRPLRHWVSSRGWIPAEEMDDAGEHTFKVGDTVEVSKDKDHHGSAWFHATIMKVFDGNTFLVEYSNVKSESNDELLKEILDIQYMRMGAPSATYAKDFASGDEVEVFLENGWLPGTVLETLDDAMYAVKLKHCEKTLKFDSNAMRYQQFWTGLKWVYKNKMSQKSLDPDGVKPPEMNKYQCKRFRPPSSASNGEGEVTYERTPSMYLVKWSKTKNSSQRYESGGTTAVSKSTNISSSGYNARSELGNSIEVGRGSTIPSGLETEKHTSVPAVEDVSSMEEQHHFNNQPPQNYAATSPTQISSHNGSMHEAETLETNVSLVHVEHCDFLPIAEWTNSKCSHASKRRKKLAVRASKRRKIALSVNLREQTQNQIIDKNGDRLPENSLSDMSKSVRGEVENPENSLIIMGSEDSRRKDELNQGVLGEFPASDQTIASTVSRQVYHMQDACLTPHTESPFSSSVLMNSFTCKPLSDAGSATFLSKLTKESKFCGSPGNTIITTGNQIVASPCQDSSDVQEDPSQTRSPQVASLENERIVLDPQPSALPPKKVPLPFVKSSVMWETIESMDIFSKIPQEPHFRPLEQHSVDFREGVAIGLMISFANLVSNIEKVTISEAPMAIEERLRDLEALEANGFNITYIKMRLEELLQIQVSWKETNNRKTMLEAHMSEVIDDSDRLNALIISYDEAIRDLENDIAHIREKRDLTMRTNESNESALVNIKREAHEAEAAARSIEERFITKLTSPWCTSRAL